MARIRPDAAAEYEALHAALDDGLLSEASEWLRAVCANLYASLRHFDGSLWVKPVMRVIVLAIVGWVAARKVKFRLPGRRASSSASEERPESEELLRELDVAVEKLGWPRPKAERLSSAGRAFHWRTCRSPFEKQAHVSSKAITVPVSVARLWRAQKFLGSGNRWRNSTCDTQEEAATTFS